MSRHPPFIRHQRLAQKNWGSCDECGKRRAAFYAIWNMTPREPGMCVCGDCVIDSQEVSEGADIYGRDEPVAWRVRIKSDDPEEWVLLPAGAGADYLQRPDYEVQPLFVGRRT